MFSILQEPDFSQAYQFLSNSIYNRLITVFADCDIIYEGRASSIATLAPRLIIIKLDGSLIVHENVKREPLNWQPPGTKILIIKEPFTILGIRRKPKEELRIRLHNIYYITSALVKDGEFKLEGDEIDFVNAVIKNPNLIENGLKIIQREYRTPYGIVDLLGEDSNGIKVIMEFKRRRASLQAVSQLHRYVIYGHKQFGKCRGLLVAPSITENALNLLRNLNLEFKQLNIKAKITQFVS
ncbi:endonuclease NucS [Acidianus manzaensis]|uniref:Endonuclease NucS n=1 Tax=Acidianus manzaensis TaxID=282676 RepID=A0A1W6K2J3_9CREN|nr:endonuclease NucS [Acidianus manzaensis]ARM76710.1 endonuclease NucS [Acidianus manzaensis]